MTVRPSPQADRVVEVMSTLAIAGPLSLSEIARRTSVNKSTMYSMLLALTRAGWLVRHPDAKTFHLGPELAALGRIASEEMPILEMARPVMLDLVDTLGVSCRAYRRLGTVSVLVDAVVRDGSVSLARGQQFPVKPPFGVIFIAWDQAPEIEAWFAGGSDDVSGYSRQALSDLIATVRERGYLLRAAREDTPGPSGLSNQVDRSAEVSPARFWELLELLALLEASRIKEAVSTALRPDAMYRVSGIDVAVRDASGRAVLALQFGPFPTPMSAAAVEKHAEGIRDAVAPISASLGLAEFSRTAEPSRVGRER